MKKILRKWLLKKIVEYSPEQQILLYEKIFQWIYSSPVWQWKLKLWSIRHTGDFYRAKLIYDRLKKPYQSD